LDLTMGYSDFLNHLKDLQESAVKPGLERITQACELLGHPERAFKSVHIAGTNGKGSTAAFLEALLRESGYRVGLYTSPHLVDVRERIQINRELISEKRVVQLLEKYRLPESLGDSSLSYFEYLTLITFLYFAEEKVDVAILETGLGGRWDATNVVSPQLSILTPIAVDHVAYLGDDLESIAKEKCGIIKQDVPVVVAKQSEDVMTVIRKDAKGKGSPIISLKDFEEPESVAGSFIGENAVLAMTAADLLNQMDFNIQIKKELLDLVDWPGRLHFIPGEPPILLDGAHNPAAVNRLVGWLGQNANDHDIIFIFGGMKDKDLSTMVKSLDEVASAWVFYSIDSPRAVLADDLALMVEGEGVRQASGVLDALEHASAYDLRNPLIVVTGSLYLVGEFINSMEVHSGEVDS